MLALFFALTTPPNYQYEAEAALALSQKAPTSDLAKLAKDALKSRPDIPEKAVKFAPTKETQSIGILDERDFIDPFKIASMTDTRWHQPGGLFGIKHRSEKFRLVPAEPKVWVGDIAVLNSFGHYQRNRGLKREYAVGTRFDEVLINEDGEPFEQRTRIKEKDGWTSEVSWKDESARPKGYTGLKQSCASCHDEAGTGKYAEGLVPGGDTVLSDPLPWHLWRRR